MSDTNKKLVEWFLSGDTGVSSKAIVAHLTGFNKTGEFSDYPSDPSDFGRCHRLLNSVPEFRQRINEMSNRSRQWAVLVEHWDELTTLLLDDYPDMYKRMKQILAEAPNNNRLELGDGISMEFKEAK